MVGKLVLEFRATDDDAWYSVKVHLKGETLSVQFQGIMEIVKFRPSDFDSRDAVERFVRRFRPVSPQLQDTECGKIGRGSVVCAACHAFPSNDMRYFDAVVEAVQRKDHSYVNGEEECQCTFVLSWIHGPKMGHLTSTGISCVCTLKDDGQVDPKVASFLQIVKSKFPVSSRKNSGKEVPPRLELAKGGWSQLLTEHKHLSFQDIQNKWNLIYVGAGKLSNSESSHQDQDIDLGGEKSNSYFILIGNLERSLSPSSIQAFIERHTGVSPQVYILLSPVWIHFARAVLLVDTKKKHENICKFLVNPDHFIVSTSGRPWVLIESVTRLGMNSQSSLGKLLRKYQEHCDGTPLDDKVMLVRSGTEEYAQAKLLRDLFIDFVKHEQLLLRRLVAEEAAIQAAFPSLHHI
ncbi:unnamed protein product [Cuscuta campestris]|uniref:SAWADEE domain-containing protein n=1 Tax=Cuscuta campestris TaxID=132261 RepID=A0A484KEG0_9ASTE|nr:unnamed protein product [Cuscuta campestris]